MKVPDRFGWYALDAATALRIQDRLASLETMRWSEILVQSKKQHHAISLDQIIPAAQESLVSRKVDDVDELISLRVTGKERIWGIMRDGVLELLWWDPEHQICPSEKKHT